MRSTILRYWPVLSLVATVAGCGDPPKYGQELEESRVIGVRMESADGSAQARADEDLTVQVLLAGPDGPVDSSVALSFCEIADSARGVPFCQGETYAEEILSETRSPELSLRVPEEARAEQRVGVLGVACESGDPILAEDPLDWSCSDKDTRPLRFSFDSLVGADAEQRNPDLSDLKIEVDDSDAPTEGVDVEPSCDDAIVTVNTKRTFELSVDLGDGARQAGESLQVSHFATAGRYERQFTILDPEESLDFVIEWDSPEEEQPTKHYLVVRDGLGGVAWSTFSVCVH